MKARIIIILLTTVFLGIGSAFAQQQLIQGQRMPRLTTEQRDQINTNNVQAEGQIIYNTDINCLEYWDGNAWRSFCENTRWFYMPSIVIDVTTSDTFTRDLHLEYKKQFADTDDASTPANSPTAGTALVKSDPNAPNPFNKIYVAKELYYYITGYDATVFSNLSITPAGVLTYTVNADNVTDATYMNIVFVVK
jgi:hypothetical protein